MQAEARATQMAQETADRKASDAEMDARYLRAQEQFNTQLSRLADAIDRLNAQALEDAKAKVQGGR